MKWNEKIIKIMQEEGITQKELSELSGVSESSLSRYLHNEKRPRLDIVVNLAKALHIDIDELLDEEERVESPYAAIATTIARKGNHLSEEERKQLVALILGKELYV